MTQTILLADDSVTIQKVIELTFMDEDYEVVSAGNGDEALDRLEEVTPDVVIADVHMPGASGFDVAKRSKQLHPAVPVLLLVGTFEPFDEADFEDSGAESYLKKPFDSQELLQRVNDLLEAAPEPGDDSLGTATEPLGAPPPPPAPVQDEEDEDISDLGTRAIPELGGERDEAVQPAAAEPAAEPEDEPFPELGRPAAAAPGAAGDDDIFRGFAEADGSSEVRPPVELEEEAPPELEVEEDSGWDLAPDVEETPPADFELETEPETAVEPEPVEIHPPELEGDGEDAAPSGVSTPAAAASAAEAGRDGELSDAEVERIARRVVELMSGDAVREVAWEVVPDLAEVVIKERLKELEEQTEPG